ncbi:MAG: DUF4344 domain-containing metallopeptidase [Rhodospirillum sp.]|nr:DUF4344 domain-containing metallopeptidase [Rhodospirillum sp.]MCF8491827.1 DUF4344 domain-containing metallopeptidase [Rhodospirillum sp.]
MFVPLRFLAMAALAVPLALLSPLRVQAQDLSDEEVEEVHDFIMGNIVFILFHEFGHALISELSLPVLGREEDAVDALATVLLLPDDPSEETDQMVMDAMDGWFLSDDYMVNEGEDPIMWDEHGLDLQRAYQVACLIYGSDPDGFSDLADSVELPEDRRETCLDDWDQAQSAWFGLLEPHILDEGVRSKGIQVIHEPAAPGLEEAADFLRETELIEVMATEVLSRFDIPERITVATTSCGEPNAFWDAEEARITICYELADFYRELIIEDIKNRSP